MSVTRLLCHSCGLPLIHCDCRTLRVELAKLAAESVVIDFSDPAPSCNDNTTATNWPAPKKKKQGRSKFF